MSTVRALANLISERLAEAAVLVEANDLSQLASGLLRLRGAINLLTDTLDEDNGNVLPGYVDQNAAAREEINEALATIVGEPIAVGATLAAGALLLTAPGVAGLPLVGAIVVGGLGALSAFIADAAAQKLIEALSAEGITLVGQLVDYSEATTGLTIIGTTAADRITATVHDDTIQMGLSDDVLYEMGGSDQVDGGFGTDELSYLRSESAVVFDLGNGEAKQGGDTDIFENIEIFSGSDFDDTFSFVGIETMSPFDPSIPYATHQNLLR